MPCKRPNPASCFSRLFICSALVLLAGCEQLGIETPETIAAARQSDGRAVGGACRQVGRALEDCFVLNKKVDRAAIFAGWRDMSDYMRENKIETVTPVLQAQVAPEADADEAGNEPPRRSGKKVVADGRH